MSLRGLSTLNFWADDVAAAAAWYSEFRSIPIATASEMAGPSGAIMYWHVDDLAGTVNPLGSILAVMSSTHYLQIMAFTKDA